MDYSQKLTLIKSAVAERDNGSPDISINCPFCPENGRSPDIHHHLYVNQTKGVYFCHRCGAKGRLANGLPGTPDLATFDYDHILADLERKKEPKTMAMTPTKFLLTRIPITPDLLAHEYLGKRGITPRQIADYGLCLSPNDLYTRVHFPGFDMKQELVCSIGRAYIPGIEPKYKNTTFERRYFIWNLHRQLRETTVIVCEGPISAMAAGYNAVVTLGKNPTEHQLFAICQLPCIKTVVTCFDRDARHESIRLWAYFAAKGLNSLLFDWTAVRGEHSDAKDPAELPKDVFQKFLQRTIPYTFANRIAQTLDF